MTYLDLEQGAEARQLTVLGGFHPDAHDPDLPACKTLLLLGPNEPAFWPHLQSAPEGRDGLRDPVDRWSARVIGDWAAELGAQALFPFGGPPHLPFFKWATRTGRLHPSPILFLVHDRAGLFVSIRGALALPVHIDLPAPPPNPCLACIDRPCLSACPVDALSSQKYDVPLCKDHITTVDRSGCMTHGCAARRACPVSRSYGRLPAQSAYHMQRFIAP